MFTPILNSPSWLTFMQSDFQMFLLIAQFFFSSSNDYWNYYCVATI